MAAFEVQRRDPRDLNRVRRICLIVATRDVLDVAGLVSFVLCGRWEHVWFAIRRRQPDRRSHRQSGPEVLWRRRRPVDHNQCLKDQKRVPKYKLVIGGVCRR